MQFMDNEAMLSDFSKSMTEITEDKNSFFSESTLQTVVDQKLDETTEIR